MQLPPAHRLAQINYPNRSGSFAFSFLVVLAVLAERGYDNWTFLFGVLTLLAYPQLAYLHARLAVDSKRAELRNLSFDSALMGLWAAQLHFALWPVCGALVGVCLNNAVCGGLSRFLSGLFYFAGAALLWAMLWGFPFEPATGYTVTGLCFLGIVGYVTALAVDFYAQNRRLVNSRNGLRTSEEQFRFIAEHAGDLVAVLSAEYRFRYATPSHAKYFAVDKFAEGQSWLQLVHADDRQVAHAFLESLRASSSSRRTTLRIVPAGGSWRVMECVGNPVRAKDGNLQQVVLVCRDLGRWLDATNMDGTESRRAEKTG